MTWVDLVLNGFIFVTIGVFAGLMAGVLGIGGGVVVVPGLLFIFQSHQLVPADSAMHVAAGTSLAIMILTAESSLRAHLKRGEVLWPLFHTLWPGIVLGVMSGASLAHWIPTHWLERIFSIFLFAVAIKMLVDWHVTHPVRSLSRWLNHLISYLIGLKSGLLGVGGGVLIIPYLTYCGVAVRKIAAVSNLCTLTVAMVGTLSFIVMGQHDMATTPYTIGYVYWPAVLAVAIPSALIAPWGAQLNYVLPVNQLKFIFIVILLMTAIKMLF